MAKKRSDANTQKFLFGIVPVNRNAMEHVRARSEPQRDLKAARKKLAQLERVRDRWAPGSWRYRNYDQQIKRFKEDNGL